MFEVVHYQVNSFRFRIRQRQGDGNLGELETRAVRCGEGEMAAGLRFYSAENIGCTSRSYALSRRASRPGSAGAAGRTFACKVTGFSSKHTTGSAGLYGFSYVSSTSSILEIYSSLSSATHHIHFSQRLEIVIEEQNPNGFLFPRVEPTCA